MKTEGCWYSTCKSGSCTVLFMSVLFLTLSHVAVDTDCHASHRGSVNPCAGLRGHGSNPHPASPTAETKARQNPSTRLHAHPPPSPRTMLFIAFVFSSQKDYQCGKAAQTAERCQTDLRVPIVSSFHMEARLAGGSPVRGVSRQLAHSLFPEWVSITGEWLQ